MTKACLTPVLHVLHTVEANAPDNKVRRCSEVGRDARIGVMASIQGQLPANLEQIKKQYGDAVQLLVRTCET